MATKKKASKGESNVGRPTRYDQGKPANKRDLDSATKKIKKAETKPSVTAVAREYMAKGWDNESVLRLLKAGGIKHSKDLAGIAALRRSLARAGDLDLLTKEKAPANKASKKKASKKKASKKASKKAKDDTGAAEEEDPLA